MRKTVKFIYWVMMSTLFLIFWYRQYQISKLNQIMVDK